jgi:hypothetical protein
MTDDSLLRFAHRIAGRFGAGEVAELCPGDQPATGSIAVCRALHAADLEAGAESPAQVLLRDCRRRCAATIVEVTASGLGTDPVQELELRLEAIGLRPTFAGWSPPASSRTAVVAILHPPERPVPTAAPASFRVAAVMTAYNERDIVRPSVERLISQGIDVYLIDNWSSDDTVAQVEDLVGGGLLAIERYPPGGRPAEYQWSLLLQRVAAVAASLDHDWVVHHDVDQRRESPWPALSYRDALFTADQWGFNAIDHTLLEFRPVDDGFVDGTEPSAYHHNFEFVASSATAVHVQAWKNSGQTVDLASSGGHDARFDGRAVFPYNFVLRHYPIRSQRHGELKVFRDRVPRYRSVELERGWHYHYARLRHGHRFIRDPRELLLWEGPVTLRDHLLPILGQVGMEFPEPSARDRLRQVGVRALQRAGLAGTYVRVRSRLIAGRR